MSKGDGDKASSVELTISMPLFRATPILVLCAPKSTPTTLMVKVLGDRKGDLELSSKSVGRCGLEGYVGEVLEESEMSKEIARE